MIYELLVQMTIFWPIDIVCLSVMSYDYRLYMSFGYGDCICVSVL